MCGVSQGRNCPKLVPPSGYMIFLFSLIVGEALVASPVRRMFIRLRATDVKFSRRKVKALLNETSFKFRPLL